MAKKGFASVTIPETTNNLIITLADKYNRSKAWVIEEAVKLYIQQHKGGA